MDKIIMEKSKASEAERSGVLQGCPPSANGSAGAGADASPDSPISSVVPRDKRSGQPAHHILKTWPEYFDAVGDRRKTFEARLDDRNFKVGDSLELREWDPKTETFTGRWIFCRIGFKMEGGKFGVEPGHCILGLQLPKNHSWPIGSPDAHQRSGERALARNSRTHLPPT